MSFFGILEGFFTVILFFYIFIVIFDAIWDMITARIERGRTK